MVLVLCDDYGYKSSTFNVVSKGPSKSVRVSGGLFPEQCTRMDTRSQYGNMARKIDGAFFLFELAGLKGSRSEGRLS